MIGALIKEGVSDWQIFQQQSGYAQINIRGIWEKVNSEPEKPCVYICVKRETTGEPVIWWTPCRMSGMDWNITLKVPVGGLYQIETCLVTDGNAWSEWAMRGDIASHIGVGDLYVIAGQSNSSGYGKDYIYDPPEMGVHILKNSRKWCLASHPLQDATGCGEIPVNMDSGNTGHSMYLSFAKYLMRELGYPIGLIQTSMGGAALEWWKPQEGVLYKNMLNRIKLAGGAVKGIVWYQGCSDAVSGLCETYFERFYEVKNGLCVDLRAESLPVLMCQLNRCYAWHTDESDYLWGTVREQQRRLGKEKDIYVVPTTDCIVSDAFGHNSAKANMALGERLAKTALTHIYGKPFLCDAPDVVSAKKIDCNKVLVEFAPVYDKLETFQVRAENLPFAVQDEYGLMKAVAYEILERNGILLSFERVLGEECVLHGAYEEGIQTVIPVDFATHIPILSFYGVGITEG